MKIGELASKCEISTDTVRFYEKEGLIRSQRLANGYRDYTEEMLFIVQFVRAAQGLGFTLAEIRKDIPALLDGELPQSHVAEILEGKIAAIDQRIEGLLELRNRLEEQLGKACPIQMRNGAIVSQFVVRGAGSLTRR